MPRFPDVPMPRSLNSSAPSVPPCFKILGLVRSVLSVSISGEVFLGVGDSGAIYSRFLRFLCSSAFQDFGFGPISVISVNQW